MAMWLCGYVDQFQKITISISCFLIDLKFISKLSWILLEENKSFSDPRLRKIEFRNYIFKKKNIYGYGFPKAPRQNNNIDKDKF